MDVGVDQPRQQHAVAQVDDLGLAGGRRGRREVAAGGDHAVGHDQPGVVVAAQRTAGERVVRGVEDPGAVDRRRDAGHADPDRAAAAGRRRSSAIVGGSLPARSGVPIGEWIRSIVGLGVALDPQPLPEPAPLRRRADQPDRAEVGSSAARRRTARSPRRGRGSAPARGCRAGPRRAPARAPARGGRGPRPGRRRGRPAARRRAGRRGSRRGAARGRGGPGSGPARARRGRRRRPPPRAPPAAARAAASPRRRSTAGRARCAPCR